MSLTQILIAGLFGLAYWAVYARAGGPRRGRRAWLLAGSVAGIFWLQPAAPIRGLDFWLPLAAVGLTALVWAVTLERPGLRRADLPDTILIIGMILAIALTRYLGPVCCLTATPPPQFLTVLPALVVWVGGAALLAWKGAGRRGLLAAGVMTLIGLLVIVKWEPAAQAAAAALRTLTGQDSSLASATDLRWMGFSYLAFRLLQLLRDRQAGKLPAYGLGETAVFALFTPAVSSGPIDRAQRFIAELRAPSAERGAGRDWQALSAGAERIFIGLFKKFAIADTLALIALNAQNAAQAHSGPWLWVMLYAYALRIYFDFSGYTDIALGLARWLGIRLPENFEQPYRKTNLTLFWNSWHMSLAQWFRAYVFNPLTRALRSSPPGAGGKRLPAWSIILAGQMVTMGLIGLWHGLTWNFLIWGLWHGFGLFIHNRWADQLKSRGVNLEARPRLRRALSLGGWFLTFHYVTLGWVWFVLPDPASAWSLFQRLFG